MKVEAGSVNGELFALGLVEQEHVNTPEIDVM